MHSPHKKHDFQAAAIPAGNEGTTDSDLHILRDIFRLLPTGVTLQNEHGEFLLANDAATALLQMSAGAAINVVIKSGSNQMHGSGWYYNRDTSLADLKPLNLGKTLKPLSSRDDLLGEMLK